MKITLTAEQAEHLKQHLIPTRNNALLEAVVDQIFHNETKMLYSCPHCGDWLEVTATEEDHFPECECGKVMQGVPHNPCPHCDEYLAADEICGCRLNRINDLEKALSIAGPYAVHAIFSRTNIMGEEDKKTLKIIQDAMSPAP